MKKYIISERQLQVLKEISIVQGKLEINTIDDFYTHAILNLADTKRKKIINLTKMFFTNSMGVKMKDWSDDRIFNYLVDIKSNSLTNEYPKIFRKPSTIVSLAYFLFKYLYRASEFDGLEYFKLTTSPFVRFFFFDPTIEEFIGLIEIQKSLSLPGKSFKVNLSSVEKEYVGRGYGSRMYLCVINEVDYLRSDDSLYPDSLNMWVNYLPNKVNVWAEVYNSIDHGKEYVKLSSDNFISPDNVKSYLASKTKLKPPR
jgi:hypothetical protein